MVSASNKNLPKEVCLRGFLPVSMADDLSSYLNEGPAGSPDSLVPLHLDYL